MAWKGHESNIPSGETDSTSLYGSVPLVDKLQIPIRSAAPCRRFHKKSVPEKMKTPVSPGQSVKITAGKYCGECGEVIASHNGYWDVKLTSGATVHVRRGCVRFA